MLSSPWQAKLYHQDVHVCPRCLIDLHEKTSSASPRLSFCPRSQTIFASCVDVPKIRTCSITQETQPQPHKKRNEKSAKFGYLSFVRCCLAPWLKNSENFDRDSSANTVVGFEKETAWPASRYAWSSMSHSIWCRWTEVKFKLRLTGATEMQR